MTEYRHLAKVSEDNKLSLYHRDSFMEDVRHFAGKDVEITLRRVGKRSNRMNRYLFGGVYPIIRSGLKELGINMSIEDVHSLMKFKFLLIDVVTNDGDVIQTIGKTSALNNSEFIEYFQKIQQYGAEYLNIYIPDPNEQTQIEL